MSRDLRTRVDLQVSFFNTLGLCALSYYDLIETEALSLLYNTQDKHTPSCSSRYLRGGARILYLSLVPLECHPIAGNN